MILAVWSRFCRQPNSRSLGRFPRQPFNSCSLEICGDHPGADSVVTTQISVLPLFCWVVLFRFPPSLGGVAFSLSSFGWNCFPPSLLLGGAAWFSSSFGWCCCLPLAPARAPTVRSPAGTGSFFPLLFLPLCPFVFLPSLPVFSYLSCFFLFLFSCVVKNVSCFCFYVLSCAVFVVGCPISENKPCPVRTCV